MLENNIIGIIERVELLVTLGFKMTMFHVKIQFITRSKNHRGKMRIMEVGFSLVIQKIGHVCMLEYTKMKG
jgi:hypothetical protein